MRRTLTKDHKQKISNAMRGTNNPNYGKQLSQDHRENISKAMLKHWSKVRERVKSSSEIS